MPVYAATKRALLTVGRDKYLLRDEFSDDRAAGSVNGTVSDSGHTRTVVDTGSDLSLSGGSLAIAGGTGTMGDPGLWWSALTRTAGYVLLCELSVSDVSSDMEFGWDAGQTGALTVNAIRITSDTLKPYDSGAAGPVIGTPVDATTYYLAVALRATGAFYFIKGGTFTTWTLLWPSATDSTATIYAAVSNDDAVPTVAYVRIPKQLWLPAPLASDSFNRSNGSLGNTDGAGHAETTGPGSGGAGVAWDTVVSGSLSTTPTEGSELWDAAAAAFTSGTYAWAAYGTNTIANDSNELKITYVDSASGAYVFLIDASDLSSDLTVGTWYVLDADARMSGGSAGLNVYDGAANVQTAEFSNAALETKTIAFRAAHATNAFLRVFNFGSGEIMWLDNLSLKPLTLSTLFGNVQQGPCDATVQGDVTLTSGTEAGVVVNLDDESSPANFVIGYHDGTNAVLDKCVGGTYTNVISAAAAYGAGKVIKVVKSGTSYSLYYDGNQIGTTQTISDAGIVDNTKHGVFSTYASNVVADLTIWPTAWAISSNTAVGTPTEGSELWDGPAAVFTSGTYAWAAQGTNTIANVSNELVITYVDDHNGADVNFRDSDDLSSDLTVDAWYVLQLDLKLNSGDAAIRLSQAGTDAYSPRFTDTVMDTKHMAFRADHATGNKLMFYALGAEEVLTIDNLSLKQLTLSSLFATVDAGESDVIATAEVTTPFASPAGLVLCLDSESSPANFVIAYIRSVTDAYQLRLDKCVAGTYTNVIAATVTYGAGNEIRVIKDGTSYSLYYNNAKVGSTSTISDAGIVDNTLHGVFSTNSENSVDDFTVYQRSGWGVPE